MGCKKINILLILSIIFVVLSNILFTSPVSAEQAGVGVLNVNPKFGHIRVEQRTDTIRLYLNISDYNSWGDLLQVTIELVDKDNDELIARFLYKQYENEEKWERIDDFEQNYGEQLLNTKKCGSYPSPKRLTVDQRCDMGLLFVFNKTWFTRLNVFIRDREGSKDASAQIDYTPVMEKPETGRSNSLLFIPWFDNPFFYEIPEYFPTLLALLFGIMGAMFCIKRRKEIWALKRNSYGNG